MSSKYYQNRLIGFRTLGAVENGFLDAVFTGNCFIGLSFIPADAVLVLTEERFTSHENIEKWLNGWIK